MLPLKNSPKLSEGDKYILGDSEISHLPTAKEADTYVKRLHSPLMGKAPRAREFLTFVMGKGGIAGFVSTSEDKII